MIVRRTEVPEVGGSGGECIMGLVGQRRETRELVQSNYFGRIGERRQGGNIRFW